MDSIIEEGNYIHDDEKIAEAFKQKIDTWKKESKESIAVGQIISAFQTLGKKFTQEKCPTYKTAGWTQASLPFHTLQDLTGLQIVHGTAHPDEFHELFYKLMVDWFQAGPSTLSLLLFYFQLNHRHLGMKEYTTSLRDEKLNKLLRAVTSPVLKKEDTPNKEFYSTYRTYLETFLNMAFVESQLMMEDSVKLLIDFAFHLFLDYIHLDDDSVNQLDKAAQNILKRYNEKWKTFSDIPRFKSYIQKFSAVAKTPGFPRSKTIADMIYSSLSRITKKLQTTGDIEIFAPDLFDLMEAIACAQGDEEYVLRVFSAVAVFFNQRNTYKDNPKVFKILAPRFMSLVSTLDVAFLKDARFVPDIMTMLENSYANNKDLTALWISMGIPLMRRPTLKTLKACRDVLSSYDKIKWKEHPQFVHDFLEVIGEVKVPLGDSRESFLKEFTNCISNLLRGLKKNRILITYGKTLMNLSIHMLELRPWAKELFESAEDVGEHIKIDVQENKEAVMEVMSRLHVVIKDEELPWIECWVLQRAVCDILESIFKCVEDGSIFSDEDLKLFTSMCVTCLEKDGYDQDTDCISHHFQVALKIMNSLIPWLGAMKKVSIAKDLVPLLLHLNKDDEPNIRGIAECQLIAFVTHDAEALVPFFDESMRIYLDKEISELLYPLMQVYSTTSVSLRDNFQALFRHIIETKNKKIIVQLLMIFMTSSTTEPELFTEDNMKDLIQLAKADASNQTMYLQIINGVCKRRPGKLVKHLDLLMKKNEWNPMLLPMINDNLCTVALYDGSVSEKVVNRFIDMVKTELDKPLLVTALNSVRLIGFKYPDVIKPKRQHFENLQLLDADAMGMKQQILDMIDGKTPEDVKKQLEAQQAAVGDLVERVDEVEGTVYAVVGEVKEQRQDLDNVKNDVTEQSQRLDQVEEVVDDTVKKVEEIDNKTLSHAPYWSRDISNRLNPASEHDWRLLSSRLGYINADIRGWAQQADPCMAMLNEWYATRKTSEATYAVLTHLQEMNREDAALIVENAMKKAEAVVEDEEFEYASPPEIFISYQWGHQEEVKLLHRHLTMAGYDCWMDIGQMGGGDKLFEKIDNGMRAAKLVISCVTTKYAKSPNCNREVTLAVGVKKPIIPLLLENCSWPPPGSMGPIFSESLYIQFFQTGQEQTNDDRYWPVDKFQELLMQLSANGLVPDEGKIDKVYRNWWIPIEEEIKIDKSKTQNGGAQSSQPSQASSENQSEESPDVFISYQWGKQKNIIKLYQRLTSLGFSCWLDIKQMGGGDSLYDKIDRGIRGSKVVVSCVTKKYSLSPNCRREVSLTDALKRPMVPLLLEDMTWPPSGPMSMVMTQLLYIGFQQESLQTDWKGSEFDQLVEKLKSYVNSKSASKPTSIETSGKNGNGQQASVSDEIKTEGQQEEKDTQNSKGVQPSLHNQNTDKTCSQIPKDDAKGKDDACTETQDNGPKNSDNIQLQTSNNGVECAGDGQSQTLTQTVIDTKSSKIESQSQEDSTANPHTPMDASERNSEIHSQSTEGDGKKGDNGEMRPRSAIYGTKASGPATDNSPSRDRLLPPPHMRPTTSKSCSLL